MAAGIHFTHFCAVFNCILQPTGSTNDVIFGQSVRPMVPNKRVKFCFPRLNRSPEILPGTIKGGPFDYFSNIYKCRPDVAGDVISGVAVACVGIVIRAKFCHSTLNKGRIIRLCPSTPVLHAFVQYLLLVAFCSRLDAASDVISGGFVRPIVPDKCVKFGNSQEVPPEVDGGGIFDSFSTITCDCK